MKLKLSVLKFLLAATLLPAQTNSLTALLQQGLFEEQATRNLDAAIADYQSLALQFDKDRQLAATAIFRLGECYRAQGKTNEAAAQYQRILRDFSDQTTLATLSGQDLAGMGLGTASPNTLSNGSETTDDEAREIIRIQQLIKNSPDLINAAASDQNTPLATAAGSGWLKVATYLLDHGANVDGHESHHNPPLIEATKAGNRAMVELLLSRGADLNLNGTASNESGKQPIHIAAENNFPAVLDALLAARADVNARDSRGNTPLMLAAPKGNLNIVSDLLAHHADVNAENQSGRTALSFAAYSPVPENVSRELVKSLLNKQADPNGGKLDAPLLCAIDRSNILSAELLLQAGANPNSPDPTDMQASNFHKDLTPLWLAIIDHNPVAVQLLLKYKANPNDTRTDGQSLLFPAINDTNSLAALLNAGADTEAVSSGQNQQTPLGLAVAWHNTPSVATLLQHGANPNPKAVQGRTLLSSATQGNSTEIVKMLLNAKADPNAETTEPPLLGAIRQTNIVSAELLLQAGANPNLCGKLEWPITAHYIGGVSPTVSLCTPLYLAVSLEQVPMVNLLLKYKADPNDLRTDGWSLLFNALSDTNILEALLAAGANVDPLSLNETEWTPLGAAAALNFPADVDILLKHGANPNVKNRNGVTPLHWAASDLADKSIFELLLANHADPNVRSSNGMTPLDDLKDKAAQPSDHNQATLAHQLADFLRQQGASENPPDWDTITVSRGSSNFSQPLFHRGTNGWNQFTLLELVAVQYHFLAAHPDDPRENDNPNVFFRSGQPPLPFPDLTHIRVRHPSADSKTWNDQLVDLSPCLTNGDCSSDVLLKWGDTVEIPESDHPLYEDWGGFSELEMKNLQKCLTRQIQIMVKGQPHTVTLAPEIKFPVRTMPPGEHILTLTSIASDAPYWLSPVLLKSDLILSSSDLSQVKVTRHDSATGKTLEWIIACSDQPQPSSNGITGQPRFRTTRMPNTGTTRATAPDLWLRDGDIIEVPEKLATP